MNFNDEEKKPQVPPIGQLMSTMNQTPPTNYDFYKDIGSEDRAKLAQQLLAQQNSPGNLISKGVAGIGDAIQNSYGGKSGVHGMQDIEDRGRKNMDAQLSSFDTNRAQRMQDMQGNQEAMMNDPNSPLSQGMRSVLHSQGIAAPSGMNANVMLKVLGPLGELSYKQAMMGNTAAKTKADIANDKTGKKLEAAKVKQARPWYQKAAEAATPYKSDESQAADEVLAQESSSAPQPTAMSFPDQEKEKRYQEWKAKQGR